MKNSPTTQGGLKQFKHGFVIMRAQPFHNGHRSLIDKMLIECENITVFFGSIQESRTEKNPFTFEERKTMFLNVYSIRKNIKIFGIQDIPHSDDEWYSNVINILKFESFGMPNVYYCGDDVNGSYLDRGDFKIVKFDRTKQTGDSDISATEIREMWKSGDESWRAFVPVENIKYLQKISYNITNQYFTIPLKILLFFLAL